MIANDFQKLVSETGGILKVPFKVHIGDKELGSADDLELAIIDKNKVNRLFHTIKNGVCIVEIKCTNPFVNILGRKKYWEMFPHAWSAECRKIRRKLRAGL